MRSWRATISKLVIFVLMLSGLATAAYAAEVQEIKTPAGHTIWLVEDHSLPLIAAHVTFLRSGTAYDPSDKLGRANMAISLLMEGAGERDAKAFNEALETSAIRLNVGVDEDTAGATLETISDHKALAFELLSDALTAPRFDRDAIERTRAKTLSVLTEQAKSPYYKLERSWQENNYANHAYAQPSLGSVESINAMGYEDLRNYHMRYFAHDNMLISVAGDVTASEIAALIDTAFERLPAVANRDNEVAEFAFPATPITHITSHDMPQTIIRFGLPGLKRNDPDYLTAFVINHIIGGSGMSSLLADEIRIKRGLAYSIHSQMEANDHAATWSGAFSTQNTKTREAVVALRQTLDTVKKTGITPSQLSDAKAFLTGSFVLNLDSNMGVANFLTIMQRYQLGSDYLEKRNRMVNDITLSECNRVLARLIRPEALRIIAVGKGEL